MKILHWRKKENPPVKNRKVISYTTLAGQVVCVSREEIKSAPRYKTRFGRVTGIVQPSNKF